MLALKKGEKTNKWTNSEIQTFLILYAVDFDAAYITLMFLLVVQMRTEERALKVCSSWESFPLGSSYQQVPRPVWSKSGL